MVFGWIYRQLTGIIRNGRSYAESAVSEYLEKYVLRFSVYAVPRAFGFGTADEQVEGSIILIGWSIATSLFTGLATVGFVLFWLIFLTIGVLRWSPYGSNMWSTLQQKTPGSAGSVPGLGRGGRFRTTSSSKRRGR